MTGRAGSLAGIGHWLDLRKHRPDRFGSEYRRELLHLSAAAGRFTPCARCSWECWAAVGLKISGERPSPAPGGKLAAQLLGGRFVNEIVAQSSAVAALYPQARTVIEMGGEDSKLLVMGPGGLVDFAMNTVCAAGTGSFLDQQARRIGVSIEKEFGELALRSRNPPHIAGRCSVFAKSDMIHLQQIATPVEDIVAGTVLRGGPQRAQQSCPGARPCTAGGLPGRGGRERRRGAGLPGGAGPVRRRS